MNLVSKPLPTLRGKAGMGVKCQLITIAPTYTPTLTLPLQGGGDL